MTQNGAKSYEDVQINVHHLFGAMFRALPRVLIVTVILCALTFLSFSFMTKQFTAETSVLLEPRSDSFAQSAGSSTTQTNQTSVDGGAIASQIQLLKSRETLLRVVDDLDLRSDPEFVGSSAGPLDLFFAVFSIGSSSSSGEVKVTSDDKIIGKLSSNLVAAQARDSRVISIKYTAENPQTASKVADALAKALVARRSGLSFEDTSDASAWLDQEIERLSRDVLAAENVVANFRVDNDLFRSTRDTTLIGQQLSDLSRQISTVSERKNAAATRGRLIRDLLSAGRSLEAVPDVRQSPVIQRMSEQKANFQASRAQSAATLLSNHPTLQALDAQILDIDRQIQREGLRIAESLETQAKIEGELEKSLRDDLVRLKISASSAERSGVTLAELEREATAKRNLLNTFLARQSEATARTNTGAIFPDVRIISTAATPTTASWPNKPLLLVLVGSISFVVQIGIIIIGELAAGNVITVRSELREDEFSELPVRAEPILAKATPDEQGQTQQANMPELPEQSPNQELDEGTSAPIGEQELSAPVALKAAELPLESAEAPVVADMPERKHQTPSDAQTTQSMQAIVGRLLIKPQNIVLVASADQERIDSIVAGELQQELAAAGASTILLNAGGADHISVRGLTDMCVGEADFGEIIHAGVTDNEFFVPWGTKDKLQFSNARFSLMIEALNEIYDVVIVECGQFGLRAPFSPFTGLNASLLIAGDHLSVDLTARLTGDANAIGIENISFISPQNLKSNVA